MKKEVIFTKKGPKPAGCYSQGIKAGDLVYVSGQVGIDPETGELVAPGDIKVQTERTLKNIALILESVGLTLNNVIKTTVFIDDIDKFQSFNQVYSEFFISDPPARSTVEISRFMKGICIEIEAIAIDDRS